MPSSRLFEMLADAYAQPDRGLKDFTAAAGAVRDTTNALKTYKDTQAKKTALDKLLSDPSTNDFEKAALRAADSEGKGISDIYKIHAENMPIDVNTADMSDPANPVMRKIGTASKHSHFVTPEKPDIPGSLDAILAKRVTSGEMTMDQAAKIKRSFSPGIVQKPPVGFRQTEDGGLEPIPGGPAAIKIAGQDKKTKLASTGELEKSKFVINNIDRALSQVGPFTTGVGGALLKNVPGTSAKNLDETLNTVRANVGFDTLQAMRQSSPTGGALGAVSDRENQLLQAVRGSLDQKQSSDQFVDNLKALRSHFSNVVLAIENQTGNPEADDAIAQVISSGVSDAEKRARIQGIAAAASAGQ